MGCFSSCPKQKWFLKASSVQVPESLELALEQLLLTLLALATSRPSWLLTKEVLLGAFNFSVLIAK